MEMQRDRRVFGAICPNQIGLQVGRAAVTKKVWNNYFYNDDHGHNRLVGKTIKTRSSCRIKCWCHGAAVQSLCTLSSRALLNKVCIALTWTSFSALVRVSIKKASVNKYIPGLNQPVIFLLWCSFCNDCMGWFGRLRFCAEAGHRLPRV